MPGNTTAKKNPGPEGVGLCKSLKGFARWWREYMLPGPGCKYSPNRNSTRLKLLLTTYSMLWRRFVEWISPTGLLRQSQRFIPRLHGYFHRQPLQQAMDVVPLQRGVSPLPKPQHKSPKHNLTKIQKTSFEYWQAGSSKSTVGFPAPLYNVEYWRSQCPLYFPEVNGHQVGMVKGVRAEDVNRRTGGWDNVNTTRLLWVNGEYDPWRSASVASDFRPGGPFVGDEDRPAFVIPKAAHCNDMIVKNAAVNEGVKKVVDAEVKKMKQWVDEFYKKKP